MQTTVEIIFWICPSYLFTHLKWGLSDVHFDPRPSTNTNPSIRTIKVNGEKMIFWIKNLNFDFGSRITPDKKKINCIPSEVLTYFNSRGKDNRRVKKSVRMFLFWKPHFRSLITQKEIWAYLSAVTLPFDRYS